MRRRLLLGLSLVLAGSACVNGGGEQAVRADDLDELAESTLLAPREFDTTLNLFGRQVRITGLVRDAYRYRATVFLDGRPLYEEVAADDARYVRVLDPRAIRSAARAVPSSATALLSGRWVLDPTGAPPEFGEGSSIAPPDPVLAAASPTFALDLLAPATVLREVRALERVPILVSSAERVTPWNTDSAGYLEANDLFPPYEADGTRFDLLPRPFDPAAVVRGIESIEPFFRTSAVWARGEQITRVETTFRFPDPADARYAAVYRSFRAAADPTDPAATALAAQGADVLRALADLRFDESRVYRAAPGGLGFERPRAASTVDLEAVLGALAGAAPIPGGAPEVPQDIQDLISGAQG